MYSVVVRTPFHDTCGFVETIAEGIRFAEENTAKNRGIAEIRGNNCAMYLKTERLWTLVSISEKEYVEELFKIVTRPEEY